MPRIFGAQYPCSQIMHINDVDEFRAQPTAALFEAFGNTGSRMVEAYGVRQGIEELSALNRRTGDEQAPDLCRNQVGIRISMDGKGRFLDNIFVERLWRTLKYECVCLHAWETRSQALADIRKWMEF